jgi:hypothetical protein
VRGRRLIFLSSIFLSNRTGLDKKMEEKKMGLLALEHSNRHRFNFLSINVQ